MRSITATICFLLAVQGDAFQGSSFSGTPMTNVASNSNNLSMEYIPSGMSKAQWAKMKEAEKAKKGKNLGKSGITTFKSRSFDAWQKSGGKNLFPVDPKSVKDPKDLPYMQRKGGSADDDDLKKETFFGKMFGKKKKVVEDEEDKGPKTNYWTF